MDSEQPPARSADSTGVAVLILVFALFGADGVGAVVFGGGNVTFRTVCLEIY